MAEFGIDTPFVVQIGNDLYVKSESLLPKLLAELRQKGYEVDSLRESYVYRGDDLDVVELSGQPLWFARTEIHQAKCKSCDTLLPLERTKVQGSKCPNCKRVLYSCIHRGSVIRFCFESNETKYYTSGEFEMKVHHIDPKNNLLYLYPMVLNSNSQKLALEELDKHQSYFEVIQRPKGNLICVKFSLNPNATNSTIRVKRVQGSYWNFTRVRVWDGEEYSDEAKDFPAPEHMSIIEAWHWDPLVPHAALHHRILRAVHIPHEEGMHHKGEGSCFTPRVMNDMETFVRLFTQLDYERWKRESRQFRRDGLGGIHDIEQFCINSIETRETRSMASQEAYAISA